MEARTKLDLTQFSSNFDINATDIPEMVQSELLVGPQEDSRIRFELYKLNVYGESPKHVPSCNV